MPAQLRLPEWARAQVFISFAHANDLPVKYLLDQYLDHPALAQVCDFWTDDGLRTGQEWERQIVQNLHNSDLILLFVSETFLRRPFCMEVEAAIAASRHASGEAVACVIRLTRAAIDQAPLDLLPCWPDNVQGDLLRHVASVVGQGIVRRVNLRRAQGADLVGIDDLNKWFGSVSPEGSARGLKRLKVFHLAEDEDQASLGAQRLTPSTLEHFLRADDAVAAFRSQHKALAREPLSVESHAPPPLRPRAGEKLPGKMPGSSDDLMAKKDDARSTMPNPRPPRVAVKRARIPAELCDTVLLIATEQHQAALAELENALIAERLSEVVKFERVTLRRGSTPPPLAHGCYFVVLVSDDLLGESYDKARGSLQALSSPLCVMLQPLSPSATPLLQYQMLPEGGLSVTEWPIRANAWKQVANALRRQLHEKLGPRLRNYLVLRELTKRLGRKPDACEFHELPSRYRRLPVELLTVPGASRRLELSITKLGLWSIVYAVVFALFFTWTIETGTITSNFTVSINFCGALLAVVSSIFVLHETAEQQHYKFHRQWHMTQQLTSSVPALILLFGDILTFNHMRVNLTIVYRAICKVFPALAWTMIAISALTAYLSPYPVEQTPPLPFLIIPLCIVGFLTGAVAYFLSRRRTYRAWIEQDRLSIFSWHVEFHKLRLLIQWPSIDGNLVAASVVRRQPPRTAQRFLVLQQHSIGPSIVAVSIAVATLLVGMAGWTYVCAIWLMAEIFCSTDCSPKFKIVCTITTIVALLVILEVVLWLCAFARGGLDLSRAAARRREVDRLLVTLPGPAGFRDGIVLRLLIFIIPGVALWITVLEWMAWRHWWPWTAHVSLAVFAFVMVFARLVWLWSEVPFDRKVPVAGGPTTA